MREGDGVQHDPTQPADATLLAMAKAEIEVYGRCTPTICKRLVAALERRAAILSATTPGD